MKYEKIINMIRMSGLFIVLMIAIDLVLASSLFVFHIGITPYHLPISIFITTMVVLIFNIKKYGKQIMPWLVASIIIALSVIFTSIIFSNHYCDVTYDGNAYHKDAVGLLKNGWNPLYETAESFYKKSDLRTGDFTPIQGIWENHYAKTTWIFASTVYSDTGNIESGKCINLLMFYSAFTLIFSALALRFKKIIFPIIISLLVVINPISIVQFMNYYNDALLGVTIYALITAMILFISDKKEISETEIYIWIVCLLIIGVNVKFTGLGLCTIYCFILYAYYGYKLWKEKNIGKLIKPTIIFAITAIIAIGLVGSTSYIKNTIDHGHPFYPLFGKGKVDIITNMQPKSFKDKSTIKKLGLSIFSSTDNILANSNREPELKVPFTFTKAEIDRIVPDTRIGGWGVLFGGIFLLSIAILIYELYHLRNTNLFVFQISIIILLATTLLMLGLTDSWWARYSPQLYLIPIMSIFLLWINILEKHSKVLITITSVFVALCLLNCLLFVNPVKKVLRQGNQVRQELITLQNLNKPIVIVTDPVNYNGLFYHLDDLGIDYTVSNKIDKNDKSLYLNSFYYHEKIDSEAHYEKD